MIPTVDFSSCGLLRSASVSQADIEKVANQLTHAFRSTGFCYLVNHGISASLVDEVFKVSRLFFEQTTDVKQKYTRPADSNHGWAGLEREKLNPEGLAGDLKESFNCQSTDSGEWPLEELPNMKKQFGEILNACTSLSDRILEVLAIGLKLQDKGFFQKCHSEVGKRGGSSTLRSLFYPRLPSDGLKPGQLRCGEHSDYGTLTILFQDDIGGLQVQNTAGEYIDAEPVSGTVVVNIGDLLQRWTSNTLKATKHRVLIPELEAKKHKCRQSVAFFVHPDDDFVVRCLDDSNTYEPITNKEYLNHKFSLTY